MTSFGVIKDCLHSAIVFAIYLSQLMGCMGFSFADAIAPCGHDIQKNTFAVIKNRSHNRTV